MKCSVIAVVGMHYSLEDGQALVRAARSTVELYLKSPEFHRSMVERHIDRYSEKAGVFVTIEHYPTMTLRGCIGFTNPTAPVSRMLVEAALAAAADDPRFVPVSHSELSEMVIEVSILSKPEQVQQKTEKGRMREIKVGRDGLIVRYGFKSGLLLPVVPVEQGWGKEDFLKQVCLKAGIDEDAWKRPEVGLYRFTAQVFREKEPAGAVEEVKLE